MGQPRRSLPVRERGLKQLRQDDNALADRSLPVRERGLKPVPPVQDDGNTTSLPVRERGLKLFGMNGPGKAR